MPNISPRTVQAAALLILAYVLLIALFIIAVPHNALATKAAASTSPEPLTIKNVVIPRVQWVEDKSWPSIKQAAQQDNNSPILLDFYATWCGPCKLLDGMVYNERSVVDELSDVLTFKVDIDKAEYAELKKFFNIELLPTLIWCDAQGREIDRFTGSVSAKTFMDKVQGFRKTQTEFHQKLDRLVLSPQDPDALLDLAQHQRKYNKNRAATILYRRLLALRGVVSESSVLDGTMGLAEMEIDAGRLDQARLLADRAIGLFKPSTPSATTGLKRIAELQGALSDTTGLRKTYRAIIAADRRDVTGLTGLARIAIQTGTELEEATKLALHAVVYSRHEPAVISMVSECYFERGLYRKAIKWIKKAVAAEPDHSLWQDQLAQYELALSGDPYGLRRNHKRIRPRSSS